MNIIKVLFFTFYQFIWVSSINQRVKIIGGPQCGNEINNSEVKECLFSKRDDDLTSISHEHFDGSDNSIFFIESSCNGGLNFKQACSVESAAKAHPRRFVNVLFLGPVSQNCLKVWPIYEILRYRNIKMHRLNVKSILKDTPIARIALSKKFWKNNHTMQHLHPILKYVLLYKYGGIYLDTDVIVAKSFDSLPIKDNWIGTQEDHVLGSALLALSRHGIGHEISSEVMTQLSKTLNPHLWRQTSFSTLLEYLDKLCGVSDVRKVVYRVCKGFQIYQPMYFYPIRPDNFSKYYTRYDGEIPGHPYAFHVWNEVSKDAAVFKDSLYSALMEKFCPFTFSSLVKWNLLYPGAYSK